ncbi:MAG: alpha-hydroxy-acid oxidizing protein [Chromatiales bacterium]|nr:alpha-hydroxy-acid oxidizing protein [Chromatiales bacterium]
MDAYSIDALRRRARARLPRMVFDFVDGAAEDERTARRNLAAFGEVELVPRVLSPTPTRDLGVDLLGTRLSMPVLVAPTGLSGMLWPRGELLVARACARAGTVMTVSHASAFSLEAVARAATGPKWFQLMIYRDRSVTAALAERAAAAGYDALCLTVDLQGLGQRERDLENGFVVPPRATVRNVLDLLTHPRWLASRLEAPALTMANYAFDGGSDLATLAAYMAELTDPNVGLAELAWLRERWDGPLVVKGVMHPDDARRIVDAGADAVVVSNHGGRQLDGAPSALEMLAPVVDAIGGRAPVLLDSGVRRGVDVLKARALGATACLVGRAHLYGLAAAGEAGVTRALEILRGEMDRAMVLGGWDSLAALDRDTVRVPPSWHRHLGPARG